MVRSKKKILTVKFRKLAFWNEIFDDAETITSKYLNEGETVTLLEEKFYYRAPWSDKPYYHVNHHIYGDGYCLAEAF